MTSKLSWHIIEPYRIKAYDQSVVNSRATVVKVLGGPSELGILSYYHDKNPGAIYIARVYPYEQAVANILALGGSPIQAADVMYSALSGFVHAAGLDWCYFECGPNEPGDSDLDWIDTYYANLIPRLMKRGIKSVAYNFSVCHPPLAYWGKLSKSLNAIKAVGGGWSLVGLHQYGLLGNMQDHAQDGEDARALRHRCIPELANVPIVLTETGLDSPGWQKTSQGVDGYLADLKWLDYELRKDANVLGACVYTMDVAPGWEPFRVVGDLAKRLFEYITTQNASVIEVPPEPEQEPEPLPDSDTYEVKVVAGAGCNMRAKATMNSELLGFAAQGSKFTARKQAENDYVYIPSLDAWIYRPNTKAA